MRAGVRHGQAAEATGPPAGPHVRLRIVGIGRRPLDLGNLGASGGVVIQTPAMLSRDEGVFHHEIEAALQRQGGTRPPLRFVLPVTLGECPLLPTLRDFHVIDLSKPQGLAALVQSIQEDWRQRRHDDPGSAAGS